MFLSRKFSCSIIALCTILSVNTSEVLSQSVLKKCFQSDFVVGAALNRSQISGKNPQAIQLVEQQFNSISPENILKWEYVHPKPDVYRFNAPDKYVNFGINHNMWVHGHTLIWYKQTPDWVFEKNDGTPADRSLLLQRMKKHIQTVAGRYKGKIKSWDVVNEAVDSTGQLRTSKWEQIIGDDYIEKAFIYAHEAAPNAKLYYNDYDLWIPAKREGVILMIKKLQSNGVPIDGLGLQTHVRLDYPNLEAMKASLKVFSKLKINLSISELDVDMLPRPAGNEQIGNASDKKWNPYASGLSAAGQQKLADRYKSIFQLLLQFHGKIERVTFWGVNDGQSWLNSWPIGPRTNYPLLFDRNYTPKPAFTAVIETACQ